MAGTYSQIYIQVVFAVKGRQNLLAKEWQDEVFKYMSGIIKNKGQKPIIVNGVSDHAHAFIGLKPSMALSDLVRDVKNNSTNFINDNNWIKGKFSWQKRQTVSASHHTGRRISLTSRIYVWKNPIKAGATHPPFEWIE